MKVRYDREVDAAYIGLSSKRPRAGVELEKGVVLHLTEDGKIVGIEILGASKRFPVRNLFTLDAAGKG
ncbi:MAG: DUF2283 domain-containing protein [Nitrospinota bacterium]